MSYKITEAENKHVAVIEDIELEIVLDPENPAQPLLILRDGDQLFKKVPLPVSNSSQGGWSYEVKPFRNGIEVDPLDEDQAIDSIQLNQVGGDSHTMVSLENVKNMHVRDSFSLNGLKIQNPHEAAAAIPLAHHPTTFSLKFNTDSQGKIIQDANGNHLVWSTEIEYILISYLAPNGDVVAERSIVTGTYASNLDTGEFSYDFGDEWTFNGWYADAECTTPFQFGTPLTEDTSIYAGVTPTIRTITWNLDGGTPSGSYPTSIPHGTLLSPPASPVREDYEFSGWTIDGLPFTEARAVTSNITVTATWEEAAALMMYYGSYVPSGFVLRPEEQESAGANVGAYNEEDAKAVLRSIIENGYEDGNTQPEFVGANNFERYNEGHYFFNDSRYAQGIEPAEKVYDRPFGGVGMCVFVTPFEVQQFAIGGIETLPGYKFSLDVNGTKYYAYFWITGALEDDAAMGPIEFNFQITYK